MKTCGTCKAEKDEGQFNRDRRGTSGLHWKCRPCVSDYYAKYRRTNPSKKSAADHEHYLRNRDKLIKKAKTYYSQSYERVRHNGLVRSYGITLQRFDEILAKQDMKCAMCRTDTPGGKGKFHVDHDHVTGKVRGLLCHKCNVGLGLLGDDPLKAANKLARYAVLTNGN